MLTEIGLAHTHGVDWHGLQRKQHKHLRVVGVRASRPTPVHPERGGSFGILWDPRQPPPSQRNRSSDRSPLFGRNNEFTNTRLDDRLVTLYVTVEPPSEGSCGASQIMWTLHA